MLDTLWRARGAAQGPGHAVGNVLYPRFMANDSRRANVAYLNLYAVNTVHRMRIHDRSDHRENQKTVKPYGYACALCCGRASPGGSSPLNEYLLTVISIMYD